MAVSNNIKMFIFQSFRSAQSVLQLHLQSENGGKNTLVLFLSFEHNVAQWYKLSAEVLSV